ncbi:hypothetical protein U1Q18_026275 [Sarracenia purpurea var. burkii]
MCSDSNSKLCSQNLIMEDEIQEQRDRVFHRKSSLLLELSAADDLNAFKLAVEDDGFAVDEPSYWYGRRIGSKKMGFEERTPLMIASLYGSTEVLNYIIGTGKVDVNRACGSDGATALHCAAAGGSNSSIDAVKLLLDASADINSGDANGNKPGDLIPRTITSNSLTKINSRRKTLEILLKGASSLEDEATFSSFSSVSIDPKLSKFGTDQKKEYPIDVSMPDINNGLYGSDEFRMYSFKVKPCSRAYSHDWTECPFVHPGENARRRDPRKYHYSCVPCPEFRKGACGKADSCEYAHGVFESWLHPAQYKTRLCKDETGCARKVCFFAHRSEELRPLYPSTGSAMPSPKSSISAMSAASNAMDMAAVAATLTPPMSPIASSSPMAGNPWQNMVNLTPPTLQLPGSRLKSALSARDLEFEMEFLLRQQLIDELSGLSPSSPSRWNNGELKATNLDDVYGSLDPSLLYQFQGLSPKVKTTTAAATAASPTAYQMRPNMNQIRGNGNYPVNLSSSPGRKPSVNGFDSSAAVAAAVMNSRSAGFAKRSQSFIDRAGAANHHHRPGNLAPTSAPTNSATSVSSNLSDWSSPDGKLDWGFPHGEEANRLKKSASFGFRSGNTNSPPGMGMVRSAVDEPDVSWVHSLVKDVSSVGAGLYSSDQKRQGLKETTLPPWVEQVYIDQEQLVA